MKNQPTDVLSVQDAAGIIGINEDTIYMHIKNGNLVCKKLGGRYVTTRFDVETFIGKRKVYSGRGRPTINLESKGKKK